MNTAKKFFSKWTVLGKVLDKMGNKDTKIVKPPEAKRVVTDEEIQRQKEREMQRRQAAGRASTVLSEGSNLG